MLLLLLHPTHGCIFPFSATTPPCCAGQTLSGDHGGGSPEEVDSALVAIDPAALHCLWHNGSSSGMLDSSNGGSASQGSSSTAGSGSQGGPEAALLAEASSPGKVRSPQGPDYLVQGAPVACRQDCSCGPDGNQCAADLLQLDFTATLAALLGVPIPFANVGKVSAELWGFGAGPVQPPSGGGRRADGEGNERFERSWGTAEEGLAAALRANVEQVSLQEWGQLNAFLAGLLFVPMVQCDAMAASPFRTLLPASLRARTGLRAVLNL